jgi:hypothetical protein
MSGLRLANKLNLKNPPKNVKCLVSVKSGAIIYSRNRAKLSRTYQFTQAIHKSTQKSRGEGAESTQTGTKRIRAGRVGTTAGGKR